MNTLYFFKSFLRKLRSHLGEPARLTGLAHLHMNSLLIIRQTIKSAFNWRLHWRRPYWDIKQIVFRHFDHQHFASSDVNMRNKESFIFSYYFIGNKAKGQISKQVLQENKARQIFRKTNISNPLIRTRMCVYQGVRYVCSSENLACFVFLKYPF